jgi:hypothetical protein
LAQESVTLIPAFSHFVQITFLHHVFDSQKLFALLISKT